ncbi:hypothetical protein ACJIZ3_013214 [Penstemon smallii]|uniref:Late embryogenesis abundant protein n=1 Tax=Penstemon smallii TaxID=265156 RepID=A0ABD3USU3_9LAMI
MAAATAMSLPKNSIFNLFRSFSQRPSLPLRRKVSRVCFTSAAKYSEVGDDGNKSMDRAKQSVASLKEKASVAASQAVDKATETKDWAGNSASDMREETMDGAGDMANKTEEYGQEAKEKTEEYAQGAKEKTEEYAQGAKEKTEEGQGENTRRRGDGVEGAWGAAQDNTQKAKDSVDADVDKFMEDQNKNK